jgi:hypothetical protein
MTPYLNLGGDSAVTSYQYGHDFIEVEFKHKDIYRYSYLRPGSQHVEIMKTLADNGEGLGAYINKYVRDKYEKKLGEGFALSI